MSIKHHFSTEQARQFCEEFGIDWHWSYAIDGRDSAALEKGKGGRSSPRERVRGVGLSSSATARSASYFKRKHSTGQSS
ncbi:MAG: hypothetical protein IH612_08340 [Desulfofustis sp.]|nr:hypothetical protein [Desulfofustis sp.]